MLRGTVKTFWIAAQQHAAMTTTNVQPAPSLQPLFFICVHLRHLRITLHTSHLYPMKQTLYLGKNYLTIAIRNLLRHPGYSLINLSGLALGIACAVLLAIYISYELSYDEFRPEVARTYRVMKQTRHANGRIAWNTGQQGPLATVLPEEFPEIEDATRFWAGLRWVNAGKNRFNRCSG